MDRVEVGSAVGVVDVEGDHRSDRADVDAVERGEGVDVAGPELVLAVVEPGRQLDLPLVKEGRDAHQAVGYLGDGTMIVVNHARSLIGKTARVSISSVLQTSAGRLFFAELHK